MATYLKYLESRELTDTGIVLERITNEDGSTTLILTETVFYPQGGGQPCDQGTIAKPDNSLFHVQKVQFINGDVHHTGIIEHGSFRDQDKVLLHVNAERRLLNNRNHTAGHLIDVAMDNLGYVLKPGKAYHYPVGAHVEYEGTMSEEDREELRLQLTIETNKLIEQAMPVIIKIVTYDELKLIADGHMPDFIPTDKPSRVMIVNGFFPIPCGGTHVENTREVGPMTIEKIKNKSGVLRISYSIKP